MWRIQRCRGKPQLFARWESTGPTTAETTCQKPSGTETLRNSLSVQSQRESCRGLSRSVSLSLSLKSWIESDSRRTKLSLSKKKKKSRFDRDDAFPFEELFEEAPAARASRRRRRRPNRSPRRPSSGVSAYTVDRRLSMVVLFNNSRESVSKVSLEFPKQSPIHFGNTIDTSAF